MWCTPSATSVESQLMPYGPEVSSAPKSPPLTVNWTPATPTLSEALADSGTAPETVAPSLGALSATVGATESPFVAVFTVSVTGTIVVGLSAPGAETVRFALYEPG